MPRLLPTLSTLLTISHHNINLMHSLTFQSQSQLQSQHIKKSLNHQYN